MVYFKDVNELKTLENALLKFKQKCNDENKTEDLNIQNEEELSNKRLKKE